jgi:GNAT superfamily N-acetyltransferase
MSGSGRGLGGSAALRSLTIYAGRPHRRRRLVRDNGEMSCELRAATVSDQPFLWEMLYLALFVPPGEPPLPRSLLREPAIARYVEGWGLRSDDSGLIALVDNAPAGAAWLRCFPASEPGYGFVDERTPELSIAVLPAHRGKGIGSRLLERLLHGVDSTSLSCDPANPSWRLYVRLGFEPLPDGRTMLRIRSSIG